MIVGIDFGTSYSCVAVMDGDRPYVCRDQTGDALIPSIVALDPRGELQVGARARSATRADMTNAVFGVKRLLGRSYRDPEAQRALTDLACRHDETGHGGIALWLGDRAYGPVEIAVLILAHLKEAAETETGEPVTGAVLGVPESFGQRQRHALRQAARRAGFACVHLLPEATAATLAFRPSARSSAPETFLVVDLGSSKFEASVLMAETGTIIPLARAGSRDLGPLARAGSRDLGGDRFDRLVVNHLLAQVGDEWATRLDSSPALRHLFKEAAEQARVSLSFGEEYQVLVAVPASLGDRAEILTATLSRRELEAMVHPDLDRTMDLVRTAMREADLISDDIDRVLLAGGCTRMPAVHQRLAEEFDRIAGQLDPTLCVAVGAALHAQSLARSAEDPDQGGKAMSFVADTNQPLGFATADGRMRVVIEAGTPYPTTAPVQMFTAVTGQNELLLAVYEGEHSVAEQNDLVGLARVELPPGLPAGSPIEVQLTLDADGVLSVAVTLPDWRSKAEINWGAPPPAPVPPDSRAQAPVDDPWRPESEARLAAAQHVLRRWHPLVPSATLATLRAAMSDLEGALAQDDARAAARLGEQVVLILIGTDVIRVLLSSEGATRDDEVDWQDREHLRLLLDNVEMAATQGDERAVRRYCSDLVTCLSDVQRARASAYEPSGLVAGSGPSSFGRYRSAPRPPRPRPERYMPGQAEVPGGLVTDRVHFSVTAPPAVLPGASFLLDVWAHLEQQRELVLQRAREMAGGSEIIIRTKGPVPVARGTVLVVHVSIDGLSIDEPQDTILWEGEVGNATFAVLVPQDASPGTCRGQARIHADGLQIARLYFLIEVGAAAADVSELPVDVERHRHAFASYSSKDRDAVLARVQGMLKVVPDLEVFLDVLSLRSGEDWAQALMRTIPASDVFYLFWSEHARRSEWVEREWRCALETRGLDFIDPVPLVSPELVPPPAELAGKHFNDWILAFMRAG
jgi:molecular chaperone DnaK